MATLSPTFTIAVVDDDLSLLQSLEILLEFEGHLVRPFSSAGALLESGSLADIDLVISDIGMPVMDGLELACVVHAIRPGLPVILITGNANLPDRPLPIDLGCYQLFLKPFDPKDLFTAISNVVPDSLPCARESRLINGNDSFTCTSREQHWANRAS
jgi:DNA-binding NtrC family response regulator